MVVIEGVDFNDYIDDIIDAADSCLLYTSKITEKDGFIARSIWSVSGDDDERSTTGSGGLPAKWYPTLDGKWFWKGDTSSDEATSHFYAVSIFYDLVAEGKEKEAAREHLKKMASYIIDCGWTCLLYTSRLGNFALIKHQRYAQYGKSYLYWNRQRTCRAERRCV